MRAIGMKSARVNFGVRPNSLSTSAKPESDGDVREQRIAVGLGAGDDLRADLAGGAGLGLDHHRLLEDRLQLGRERPRHQFVGAARRKRIDDGDGVGRDRRPAANDGRTASAAAAAALPATKRRLSMRSSRPVAAGLMADFAGAPYRRRRGVRRDQSMIATARVQPAEAPRIFTGKQLTMKPVGRQRFEIVQLLEVAIADLAAGLVAFPDQAGVAGLGVFLPACGRTARPSSSRRCR